MDRRSVRFQRPVLPSSHKGRIIFFSAAVYRSTPIQSHPIPSHPFPRSSSSPSRTFVEFCQAKKYELISRSAINENFTFDGTHLQIVCAAIDPPPMNPRSSKTETIRRTE